MRTTEILSEEHVHILKMLDILENVCNKLENATGFPKEDSLMIIDFFQGYGDKFHHGKEEDLLFPTMIKRGVPKEGGPIAVMLYEHDEGRSRVRSMKQFSINFSAEVHDFTTFKSDAEALIDLLRAHIDKEDNILYKMADRVLTNEDQVALLEEYKKVDTSRESEFLRNLETLKLKYLS